MCEYIFKIIMRRKGSTVTRYRKKGVFTNEQTIKMLYYCYTIVEMLYYCGSVRREILIVCNSVWSSIILPHPLVDTDT
jgi:hypothetical protein